MLEMIGVGPFLTIPLILSAMGGPQAMLGWVLGAIISVCDGLVWAELGAALPGSGGPYLYLREAFGPEKLGRLMSFIFLWGTVSVAPLSIASGSVGFSQYLKFVWPTMSPLEGKLIAGGLCLVAMLLLYRETPAIGRLSVAMLVIVLGTLAWVIVAGLTHFYARLVFDFPAGAFQNTRAWWTTLGAATLVAIYDYGGYQNVVLFGGEVQEPGRTIPRSILYAILIVGAAYFVMNLCVIGVVPWREAMHSNAIISDMILRIHGAPAARVMTGLILFTAFASVFATMLGYSRLPFAAAAAGEFFSPFARLHPVKRFPAFSVLVVGTSSAAACLFNLDELIKALIILQIFIQSIAQIGAVVLLRRREEVGHPFRMWLYPLPCLLALAGWIYILASNEAVYVLLGAGLFAAGSLAYLWRARTLELWPFEKPHD
jgi:amino acid transporter